MAVVKIITIRARLDARVNYIINVDKTALNAGLTYITNPEKTEQSFFVSTVLCGKPETAFCEMTATKRRWNKEDDVQGYHLIQSFAPGEITPEKAHAIGREYVDRLFGGKFEAVIATHLDKAHIHNHVIVNSVSCVDGSKFHFTNGEFHTRIQAISDQLCREQGLSVIDPQGRGLNYAEWRAAKRGKPTIRSMIREDMDELISKAYTLDTFFLLLEKKGYIVKRRGPRRKYTTLQPPGGERAIRLASLGDDYTEEAIRNRLNAQRQQGQSTAPAFHPLPVKHYKMRGCFFYAQKRKITGFQALYLRYVYLLRRGRRSHRSAYLPFSVRQELVRLERYQEQFRYLTAQKITTQDELADRMDTLTAEIAQLERRRQPLYQERRNATDEETKVQLTEEIDRHTASLREKRRELALCRRIQSDIPKVSAQIREARRQLEDPVKEGKPHEHQWRSR